MNRRGFLARLFAAPIVALALLKAPVRQTHDVVENKSYDIDEMTERYVKPAAKAMADAHEKWLADQFYYWSEFNK